MWKCHNHLLDQNLAPQNQNSQRLEKGVYHTKLKLVEVQNSLHALSVSVWFFVPAFYRDALPKISQYALNNFDCSEKTILRASLHSVSGTWDLKNTKANSLCLYVFSFLVLFILWWKHCSNINILQSKYYQGTCIIFTGSCLPEYFHCGNHF